MKTQTPPTPDVAFEEFRTERGELEPREFGMHRLALQLNGPVPMEIYRDGRFVRFEKGPGRFAVTPAGATVGVRWSQSHHFLLLNLNPGLVSRVVAEVGGRDARLVERHGCDDPHARHLLLALRADAEANSPSGRLYTDTLTRALVVRLLAGYVEREERPAASKPIDRAREFMEANLDRNLALEELAEVAGLSPCHFARTFAKVVGEPPHRYLLARRLERAKGMLVATDRPIVEIALRLGFASQAHFHRAFRKHAGATPGAYRRGG